MRPLDEIQREFFSAVQMPLRGRSRESTELAPNDEGHSPVFFAIADELMKPGSNLSSAERLELYHRQYWFRLLDSVAEDFPVLQKIAGEETFWKLIEAYLTALPSNSFTLRHLGGRMADFIAGWDGLDKTRQRWFAALARLEYAYMEIYEAAEWEPVPPERFMDAELALQPHVILLDLPVPADRCAEWEDFSPDDETPVYLAIWRGESGAHSQCPLEGIEFELLKRLRKRGLLESLFAEPTEHEPSPDEVARWFASWQQRKWIALSPTADVEEFPTPVRRRERDNDWSGVDKMGSQARAMED